MPAPDSATGVFIKRLLLGTRSGRVEWEMQSPQGWFSVETSAGTASVRTENEEGGHPYVFEITNADGVTVAHTETLRGEVYADWEREIGELFSAARDSALGVQQTLSSMTDLLNLPELPPDSDIPF